MAEQAGDIGFIRLLLEHEIVAGDGNDGSLIGVLGRAASGAASGSGAGGLEFRARQPVLLVNRAARVPASAAIGGASGT